MKNKKRLLFLGLVFLLACFLRFYHLNKIPPSLNTDEVAFGYNAYSILKTGKDEFGQKLPLAFKSINDYKAPLTVYLIAFSENFFGLNQFAVRFPSALLGSLSVLLTFFLSKEIFPQKKFRNLPLLTTFLLAISPWHLQYSRTGIDPGPALFFILFGTLLFLKAQKKPFLFILSAFFLALSLYTYHSPRVFTPLLVVGLIITSYKFFKKNKKTAFTFIIFFLLTLLPLIQTILDPKARTRIMGVSVFSDIAKINEPFIKAQIYDQENNLPFSRLFHNRRLAYGLKFIEGYLFHFRPDFFFNPQGLIYSPPSVSLLYLWELPLILIGLYFLVKNLNPRNFLVLWWILITPIPAAPTWGIPHPNRVLNFLPMLQILSSLGLLWIIRSLKFKKNIKPFKKVILFILFVFFIFNFSFYLHQYYFHLSHQQSTAWSLEQKKLVDYVKKNHQSYQKIITFPNLGNPLELIHSYFLFYWPYDPKTYLQEGGSQVCEYGMTGRFNFGKFEFRSIFCFPNGAKINPLVNLPPQSMIITDTNTYQNQKEFPPPIKTIYNEENNTPLILVYNSNDILVYQKTHPSDQAEK